MHEISADGPCANCATPLAGPYCSHCGQRAVELRPTLHDVLHEASHELLHFDGKIIRTLGLLLFKPGALTVEFLAGKRARSITPIRLYLLASVLFFGLVALHPPSNLKVSVPSGDQELGRAAARMNQDPSILAHALTSAFPKAMFVLMPLFALLVFAFYWRRVRMYVPHFYFTVHYHAFVFTMLALFNLAGFFHGTFVAVTRALLVLAVLPWLAIALRRVYGGGRILTVLKTVAIAFIDLLLLMTTVIAITYITLRRGV